MKSLLSPSWKTSISGVLVFVDLLVGQLKNVFDDSSTTTFDYNLVIAGAILLWGMLNARDNDVTSERAKA
jgi:hypothetical protein